LFSNRKSRIESQLVSLKFKSLNNNSPTNQLFNEKNYSLFTKNPINRSVNNLLLDLKPKSYDLSITSLVEYHKNLDVLEIHERNYTYLSSVSKTLSTINNKISKDGHYNLGDIEFLINHVNTRVLEFSTYTPILEWEISVLLINVRSLYNYTSELTSLMLKLQEINNPIRLNYINYQSISKNCYSYCVQSLAYSECISNKLNENIIFKSRSINPVKSKYNYMIISNDPNVKNFLIPWDDDNKLVLNAKINESLKKNTREFDKNIPVKSISLVDDISNLNNKIGSSAVKKYNNKIVTIDKKSSDISIKYANSSQSQNSLTTSKKYIL
jgi:hypothetical protein